MTVCCINWRVNYLASDYVKTYLKTLKSVLLNRGSAEPQGSVGIYQGFRNNRIISFWFIYCPRFFLEWSQIYFHSTDLQHQPSRERSDTIKNGFEHTLQNLSMSMGYLSMSMGFLKLYFVAKGVPRTFGGTKRVPHSQKGWETLI